MEKILLLIGRIFFSLIFILAGYSHVMSNQLISYAAAAGVPSPDLLVPLAGLLSFMGGLSVLLGYKAKWGAWFIVIFLVPVTLVMHRFWGATDSQTTLMQMTMFQKNLSMLGGALLIAHFGSGPYSLENYLSSLGKRG